MSSRVKIAESGLIWLLLSVVSVALDQWSKHWAVTKLSYAVSEPVLPHLNWTLLYNHGAAFSFLSDAGGWQRWFFTALALGVTLWLVAWLAKIKRTLWQEALPLSLIISGAVGNVMDRIRFGYVVDFIDVYYQQWHWPAFNIADMAVVSGAILLLLSGVLNSESAA